MIRGLVENEHVRLQQHDAAEEQSSGLAPREGMRGLQAFLAGEQHLAEQAVDILARRVRVEAVQPLDGGGALLDEPCLVLRKVADRDFMPPLDGAGVDVARIRRHPRGVGHQHLQQGGLALTVAAGEHDFLAALHHAVKVADDLVVSVGLAQPLELEHVPSGRAQLVETDVGALDVRARQIVGLQPLDFLAARLHLARTRAGREALDEVLQLRNLLGTLRVLGLDARPDLCLGHHHLVVAAGVGDDGLVVDVGGVRADGVQEMPVVRDDDEGAVVAVEELDEPVNRVEVEVVGRFVEQQRLGMPEQGLRQQHTHLLAALQLAHPAGMQFVGNVEALQQDGRIALG